MVPKSTQFTIECGYMFEEPNTAEPNSLKDDNIDEDGVISNISLQKVDEYALEDELSAYMAELRAREQR